MAKSLYSSMTTFDLTSPYHTIAALSKALARTQTLCSCIIHCHLSITVSFLSFFLLEHRLGCFLVSILILAASLFLSLHSLVLHFSSVFYVNLSPYRFYMEKEDKLIIHVSQRFAPLTLLIMCVMRLNLFPTILA